MAYITTILADGQLQDVTQLWLCGGKMAERDIVAAILRLLKKTPGCFSWKTHGGAYGTAGIPDIIACLHGRFLAFEVKTETGKLSKLQEITIQRIREAKGKAKQAGRNLEVFS